MKPWIIGFVFTCMFPCGIFSNEIPSKADSLFNAGNYKMAALYYEMEYFNQPNLMLRNEILLKKANAYKRNGEYSNAIKNLERFNFVFAKPETREVVNYELSFLNLLNKDFDKSIHYAKLLQITKDDKMKESCIILQALALNGNSRWDEAKNCLLQLENLNIEQKELIESWYSKPPKIKKKKTAYILGFIPGLGIAYAGKPLEGLFNFSINAAFLSFGVFQIIETYYITGYFVGAIGINKFYFGGRAHAKWLIDKGNFEKTEQFNEKLTPEILKLVQ